MIDLDNLTNKKKGREKVEKVENDVGSEGYNS